MDLSDFQSRGLLELLDVELAEFREVTVPERNEPERAPGPRVLPRRHACDRHLAT